MTDVTTSQALVHVPGKGKIYKETFGRKAAEAAEKSKVSKFFSKVGSVPKGAHNLIADTFVGKNGATTALKTTSGYLAAGTSGGVSAWLTNKLLPESVQGALRKVTVGGAGVGGAFLPSLTKKLVSHIIK